MDGVRIAVAGIAAGIAAAAFFTRWLGSLLFGVKPLDPLTFAIVPIGLLIVALMACAIPVRRALGVDPAVTLHEE